jgi:Sugar (and other) transporter
LITGFVIIGFCHLFVSIFAATSSDRAVIFMMIVFITTYVITNGPIIWLYVSEIVVDAALGVCLFVLWSVILLLSLFTSPLMESFLHPTGVFLLFGIVSLFGAYFTYMHVLETANLSDKEKKVLYVPIDLLRESMVSK